MDISPRLTSRPRAGGPRNRAAVAAPVWGRRRVSNERWLVSYADFITLLFAFFATMYAISSVDAMKLSRVAHALQVAFDDSARGRSLGSGEGLLPERGTRLPPPLGDAEVVRRQITGDLARDLEGHHLNLIVDPRGLTLSIPEAGAFQTGSDELSPAAEALIGRIARALAQVRSAVRVEGHTDDLPIRTARFRSNWDLSTARASRVVEFLIERGIAPERLAAAGYAEFHPRAPNDSVAARASNRRVDLVVLNAATRAVEEPAASWGVQP